MVVSPLLLVSPVEIDAVVSGVVVGYDTAGDPIVARDPIVRFTSLSSAARSLDPATCDDITSAHLQAHVYEGLYAYDYLARPVRLMPLLASDLPLLSADGLTMTIRIKPDVVYARHDCFGFDANGRQATRAVTAADFVLAVKRIADHRLYSPLWPLLRGRVVGLDDYNQHTRTAADDPDRYNLAIDGVRALDDHTLQITLTEPFPQLPFILAGHHLAPMPQELFARGFAGRPSPEILDPTQVVSTGAFRLESFRRKQQIVLTRNPDFRNRDDLLIDAIVFDHIAEPHAEWMRFVSRQTDMTSIPPELFDRLVTPEGQLRDEWQRRGMRLIRYDSPSIYWLAMNMNDPVLLASPALRRAICQAIDVESFIQTLRNGRGRRAANCVPSTIRDLSAWGDDARRQAGPGQYFNYDPAAAKALLAVAKAELAEAGLLVGGEIPDLSFDLPGRDALQVHVGDFYRRQLERLGLGVAVRLNDWTTFQQKRRAGEMQLFTMRWRAQTPDAMDFLQLFYGGHVDGVNWTGYANDAFDAIYEQARAMDDGPERTQRIARMIRIVSNDCPVLPTVEPEAFLLAYDWLEDVTPHPIGYGFGRYVRINTDLRRRLGGREK